MRSYIALSGRDGAFGWGRETPDGVYELTFSGLQAGKEYLLPDGERIMANADGGWFGRKKAMPHYVTCEGRLVLCDEQCISWEEAALLTVPEKPQKQSLPQIQKTEEQKGKTTFRTHLHGKGVDALPHILWPAGSEEIRRCMENGTPVYILPHPWRFVIVPGTKGQCAAGRYMQDGRITKTAAAVRARGGLIQPKGLQGYSYVPTQAGQAYWMLIREFT